MDKEGLNQISSARADFGRFTHPDGSVIEFIELRLGYLNAGTHHSAPVLTMGVDQARSLAMLVLTAADKAQGTGKTPGSSSQ